MISPFNFMQQLALPFCLDITHQPDASAAATAAAAAAVFNIAAAANFATQTAMLQHAATTVFNPHEAAQMAATASQLLGEKHEQVIQQLQTNNCNLNATINEYQQNEVFIHRLLYI